ncbi:hypothetical protein [Burkholderia pyrrocinia]|uniref:hypothetical protein n=1 Tax=Burkholderia pyrrocinia TaxID=60550 RepID=UPI002AB1F9F6|nr:hypothetical protein [Burkholderia pyrrocinia]
MKRPSKSAIARENVSRLASIGIGSMEIETLRAAREVALRDLRTARRACREECEAVDVDQHESVRGQRADYDRLASGHKNARARFQREVKCYRAWLAEVMA